MAGEKGGKQARQGVYKEERVWRQVTHTASSSHSGQNGPESGGSRNPNPSKQFVSFTDNAHVMRRRLFVSSKPIKNFHDRPQPKFDRSTHATRAHCSY